ncbi:L,D-transpeptidase [Microbulbifer sp. TYP-18]|uniref:L,D-transpeptidase n=1 Tax=Microbulbifer sp. TYP-18 TaxID=3230024 RepID=UPI0034C668FF
MHKYVWTFVLGFLLGALHAVAKVPANSTQMVLTISDGWDLSTGQLYTFNRVDGRWQRHSIQARVNIGRAGLGWGLGLHAPQEGVQKREGDGRAPAGIFRLGDAFGYLSSVETELAYRPMHVNQYCIDMPASPYYNQTVDVGEVGIEAVRGSSEGMRRDIHYGDNQYRKGIFINHNPDNMAGAGSCIFMHLWKKDGAPTAGCTSLSEPVMDQLLSWLNREARPVYVVLPLSEYLRKRDLWSLPQLDY